jgi:serine protease AprX
VAIFVTIVMLLGLVPAAQAAPDPLANAELAKLDPALVTAIRAGKKRNDKYSVIVLRAPAKSKAERRAKRTANDDDIRREGGRINHRLGLIDGDGVTLSARAIARLSRNDKIKAISLDRALRVHAAPLASLGTITAKAPQVWNNHNFKGNNVTIAVLDSGLPASADLSNVLFGVDVVTNTTTLDDLGGHGAHVAGIIAGNGSLSDGAYQGVAPLARLISVKVTTNDGVATYSSIIRGLQWVVANAATYNIKVINMSLGADAITSFVDDPLDAAVELAWFRGVTVVSSAGNAGPGPGTVSVPGNDPYIITVGAYDDNGTESTADDVIPDWSSRGPTPFDNLQKPDLVASGRRIVSLRAPGSFLDLTMPDRVESVNYFRLSGTSMAAPQVAGTVALMLNARPNLTPNQIKYILKQTARPLPFPATSVGVGALDSEAAVALAIQGVGQNKANKNQTPNRKTSTAIWPIIKTMQPVWRNKGPWSGRVWVDGGWDQSGFRTTDGGWNDGGWDQLAWNNLLWEDMDWENANWSDGGWDDGGWDDGGWDSSAWDPADLPPQPATP